MLHSSFLYFTKCQSHFRPTWLHVHPCHPLKVKVKIKVKLSLCLTKHHTMKTYWGVVSLTSRSLYRQGKSPHYPLDRRLGGFQSRSGRFTKCQSRFLLFSNANITARTSMSPVTQVKSNRIAALISAVTPCWSALKFFLWKCRRLSISEIFIICCFITFCCLFLRGFIAWNKITCLYLWLSILSKTP
jgi:hypothetical protein